MSIHDACAKLGLVWKLGPEWTPVEPVQNPNVRCNVAAKLGNRVEVRIHALDLDDAFMPYFMACLINMTEGPMQKISLFDDDAAHAEYKAIGGATSAFPVRVSFSADKRFGSANAIWTRDKFVIIILLFPDLQSFMCEYRDKQDLAMAAYHAVQFLEVSNGQCAKVV